MIPIPRSFEKQSTIAVVGLGCVGLPLAVKFGKRIPISGLYLSMDMVAAYSQHIDPTGEVSTQDLQAAMQLQCYTVPVVLKEADVVNELQDFGCEVHVHNPLANSEQALHEYGITLSEWLQFSQNADAIVAAVSHAEYTDQPVAMLLAPLKPGGVFIDNKSAYMPEAISAAGAYLWRL